MTPFILGLLATVLWIGVIVGVWIFQRNRPETPERSVKGFLRQKKKMAKVVPPPEGLSDEPTVATLESPDPAASRLVRALQAELGEEAAVRGSGEPDDQPTSKIQTPQPQAETIGQGGPPRPPRKETANQPPPAPSELQARAGPQPTDRPSQEISEEPSDDEAEMAELISSIQDVRDQKKKPKKPKKPKQLKREPEGGPKTTDGVTYYLVDDEGQPLLD